MRDPKLIYQGNVKDGVISLPKRLRKEVVQAFEGKYIQVVFKRKRKRRSDPQNRFYWGVVIPEIIQGMIELGNNDLQLGNSSHAEMIHEFLKSELLDNGEEIILAGGELKKLPPSTTTTTTTEFMEYLDKVNKWAGEFLGITIPHPSEQTEMFH